MFVNRSCSMLRLCRLLVRAGIRQVSTVQEVPSWDGSSGRSMTSPSSMTSFIFILSGIHGPWTKPIGSGQTRAKIFEKSWTGPGPRKYRPWIPARWWAKKFPNYVIDAQDDF